MLDDYVRVGFRAPRMGLDTYNRIRKYYGYKRIFLHPPVYAPPYDSELIEARHLTEAQYFRVAYRIADGPTTFCTVLTLYPNHGGR